MKTEADFRKELQKVMPGYKWTIKKKNPDAPDRISFMKAEGVISSGFNRLSTIQVQRREKDGVVSYEVRSAGFGLHSYWLTDFFIDSSLQRVLRKLQNHYGALAAKYRAANSYMEEARKPAE